jgi:hypothetical protein
MAGHVSVIHGQMLIKNILWGSMLMVCSSGELETHMPGGKFVTS